MNAKYIAEVRAFNRFYTNVIGLLNQHLLNSNFSLPEGRILYELGKRRQCTASEIIEHLNMDRGYCSRILTQFEKKKIVTRKKSAEDGRSYMLTLTPFGKKAFKTINKDSQDQIDQLLRSLTESQTRKLLRHMRGIRKLLDAY